jgi:hypothetical protein
VKTMETSGGETSMRRFESREPMHGDESVCRSTISRTWCMVKSGTRGSAKERCMHARNQNCMRARHAGTSETDGTVSQTRAMSRLKRKPGNTTIATKDRVSTGYFTGQDGRSRNGCLKAEYHQQTSAHRRVVDQCLASILHGGHMPAPMCGQHAACGKERGLGE